MYRRGGFNIFKNHQDVVFKQYFGGRFSVGNLTKKAFFIHILQSSAQHKAKPIFNHETNEINEINTAILGSIPLQCQILKAAVR